MKLTGLLIAILVLAGLLGVVYWSNHHKFSEEASPKSSPSAAAKILSLNQADITHVTIRRKAQAQTNLSRGSSGAWQITAPEVLTADQEEVSKVLSTLSSLNADRLLEEKAADLAPYGLANPELEVDVTLKDNKTQKLLIGDETPSGNAFYAVLAGEPRLFTLGRYLKSSLDKTGSDLRDKRLLSADFDNVSQIELLNRVPEKKCDLTIVRSKDGWQILSPKPYRADARQVEALIRLLREARMELSPGVENPSIASAFDSARPFVTTKIMGASGSQQLEIRKNKDGYYAKSSAVPGIFKVSSTLGSALDKDLDDFRDKKLFDFGYSDPTKIEIRKGAQSYFFTRSDSDWWGPDGKKLDRTGSATLVNALRELSAEKFPDSGFSSPVLEITVTSDDGKRVEHVSFAKNGEAFVAKREKEPALYQFSFSSVQQVEEAASNIKAAGSPH